VYQILAVQDLACHIYMYTCVCMYYIHIYRQIYMYNIYNIYNVYQVLAAPELVYVCNRDSVCVYVCVHTIQNVYHVIAVPKHVCVCNQDSACVYVL